MMSFLLSLTGRYILLFVLLGAISFNFYHQLKSSIEGSMNLREMSDAIHRENLSLRAGDILMSDPSWMHAHDKYERKSN